MSKSNNRVKILTIAIVVYMLAALSWWSVLLLRMNKAIYDFNLLSVGEGSQLEFEKVFLRQKNMILGEGFVFAMALIIGIYLLYKSYIKEVTFTKRQNNFLLSVTHELKTPLSVMKLINQTLGRKNLTESKRDELLVTNDTEITRLENLVNNLLISTKIDHGYKLNFERVDLSEFLTTKINSLESRWPQRIIKNFGSPIYANIDQELFSIAILNLIDNASKYSSEHSEIELSLKQNNNQVNLSILDQGIGISESDQKNIFDKFYRSGNEEIRKNKGTGLGLFLVKEILKMHTGSITVTSQLEKGSSFTIKLPCL